MEYAKIENGIIKYAPKNLGRISNFNLKLNLLKEQGYLPVENSPRPTDSSDYVEKYKIKNNKIIIFWEKRDVFYQDKRLREYPQIGDVIDAICKKLDGDDLEYNHIQQLRKDIKIKYPKPELIQDDNK